MFSKSLLAFVLVSICKTKPGAICRVKGEEEEPKQKPLVSLAASACIGVYMLATPAAASGNPGQIWKCLLDECRPELARCIADPSCAANAVCLETCGPDNLDCQIRCGDMFQSDALTEFNTCVITRKKCVLQKADDGAFPLPPDCALVQSFNTEDFTGEWYITSGLNPAFDTFDCQVHEFLSSPHALTGKLTWRIHSPDGGFITRDAVQRFVQNPEHPGHLMNHGNEYLHYQDDWFIVASKFEKQPDDYVFVYYKGSNDAWDGYGGAIVYTRSASLPRSIIPHLKVAAAKVGLNFDKFTTTDNSCKPQPTLLAKLEKKFR